MAEDSENIWLLDNVQIASPCPKSWDEMQATTANVSAKNADITFTTFRA